MIKSIYFPNIEFKTELDFFHALKTHSKEIIDFKTSIIHKSIEKGQGVNYISIERKENTEKLNGFKNGFIYPIINSTGFMDSHDDCHFKGCYTKTVSDRQGKVYFVDTHGKTGQSIISRKSDIKMFIDDVDWRLLGKNYNGLTECLLFEINRSKVKPEYLELMDNEDDIECSIQMQYVKMFLAINSKDPSFVEEYKMFEKHIDEIANKDLALEKNYFFGVTELKIVNEGSLCPITGGSNSATRVYQNKIEAVIDTSKNEPSNDTQTEEKKNYYKHLI